MFAQTHGLCESGYKSWIWVMKTHQCWLMHGYRPTTLAVQWGWLHLCRGKRADGKFFTVSRLCWESQTTPKHTVSGRNKLQTGGGQMQELSWTGFWEGKGERRGGIRRLEWRDTVGHDFSASCRQADVAGVGLRERLISKASSVHYDLLLWTMDRHITTQVNLFWVCLSPNSSVSLPSLYSFNIYALCISPV